MTWWQWLLVITGSLCLTLCLAIYVGWQWVKWKLKKAFSGLGSAFLKCPIPQTIDLIPAPDTDLTKHPALQRSIATARELGFEIGGPFGLKDQPAMILMTLAKPAESVVGTIVDAGKQNLVFDFVTGYLDGTDLTHTTLEDQGFDRPPHRPFVRRSDSDLRRLYAAHLAERPVQPMRSVQLDELPALIKESVENDWFWRAAHGGISNAELDRHLAIQRRLNPPKEDEDPKAMELGRIAVQGMIVGYARNFIETRLREKLLNTTTLGAREWATIDARLVYVYQHADFRSLANFFWSEQSRSPDDVAAREDLDQPRTPEERALRDGDTRAVFAELNDKLEPSRQLTKLQEVTIESKFTSVTADVYVRPKRLDNEED